MMMNETLNAELQHLRAEGLYRSLKVIDGAPGDRVTIGGRTFINFSSNNYLGLAQHPAVVQAAADAAQRYGAGGTSSRLVAGSLDCHRELEEKLAALKRTAAALAFPSGFQANIGIISTLLAAGDCIIMDRLNHASLWDAAKLSKARVFVYPHRDMNGLEKVLKRSAGYRRKLVVTDSVFSMDGDRAPLADIVELCGRYGAWSMVDEAHATGIFGAAGAGLAEECGCAGRIDIVMGTLSKALGSQGAFVCGSRDLIEYLVNRCRSFIYTTALAPSCAAAASAAIDAVRAEPQRRARLLDTARLLREKLAAAGYDTAGSESQIIPLVVGPVTETVSLAAQLWAQGFLCPAIRPPTVPEGKCRLRFSLTSGHEDSDIAALFSAITEQPSDDGDEA